MSFNRWVGTGILIAVLLVGPQEVQAKVYSVQVGAFQILANAQACLHLFKTTRSNVSDQLRIEKQGRLYKVKVGKIEDPEKAMILLLALKADWPGAFIVPGETPSEMTLRPEAKAIETVAPSVPPKREPPSLGKKAPDSAGKSDTTGWPKRAELMGTVSEIIPLDSEQLGMPPGNMVYQLIVWVEGIGDIGRATDFLKVKIGELSTFYSETRPAVLRSGNKIKAMVEYRGNPFGGYYWIVEPQIHQP
ncbi:MAG: SPOR domain-containing protein [Thermodesulfobacteriota bacterium]